MTRKDYALLASAFRDNKPNFVAEREIWADVARALSDKLAQDNPRFDRERFLTSCVRA